MKRYTANVDSTLEMTGCKEEHKNVMAGGEDVGLSQGFFFFIGNISACIYVD